MLVIALDPENRDVARAAAKVEHQDVPGRGKVEPVNGLAVDQVKEGRIWLVHQVAVSQVQAGPFGGFKGVLALAHFK